MVDNGELKPTSPLDDRRTIQRKGGAGVTIAPAVRCSALILRGDAAVAEAAGGYLGFELPSNVNSWSGSEEQARAAAKLGPDEWLILAEADRGPDLEHALASLLTGKRAAVVDVSERFVGVRVDGRHCRDALAAACSLDLPQAQPGFASRCAWGKAEATLLIEGPEEASLWINRTLAPYAWDLLVEAGREFGLEAK